MSLTRLIHYSVRTHDIAATRDFYVDVLGLHDGYRPNLPFPGVWLYLEHNGKSQDVVHVIGVSESGNAGLNDYLSERDAASLHGSGAVDHLAFSAVDHDAFTARLTAKGIPFRQRTVPNLNLQQLFLDDPNGIVIELNFPTA